MTELIHQQFGVRYHPAHGWKVLTALGWSCQKPERRAVERDEAAIARWKRVSAHPESAPDLGTQGRDQRDLPSTRTVLVQQRTPLKKRLHATLAQDALHDAEADDRQSV